LLSSTTSAAAAFAVSSATASQQQRFRTSSARTASISSSSSNDASLPSRPRRTAADAYYRTHGELPLPKVMHAVLPPDDDNNNNKRGILVIGDVHGCYDEMLLLHEQAVQEHNHGNAFRHVVLVGDLCNKGKKSVDVIRHVQSTPNWWSVRGNHDDGALRAALMGNDAQQQGKKKYHWIHNMNDSDVEFLSELPYTLRIPKERLLDASGDENTVDTLIVHAGLIPGVKLEEQSIETMVTLREVELTDDGFYRYYHSHAENNKSHSHYPWASVWRGPEQIVFGHDARRELQQHEWATGLDTGACYGKKLTGLILPDNKLVQVEALEVYCQIGGNSQD